MVIHAPRIQPKFKRGDLVARGRMTYIVKAVHPGPRYSFENTTDIAAEDELTLIKHKFEKGEMVFYKKEKRGEIISIYGAYNKNCDYDTMYALAFDDGTFDSAVYERDISRDYDPSALSDQDINEGENQW